MIIALLIAAADVQPSLDDPLEIACLKEKQSQQGMNQCEGEAFDRADKALNAEWAKVVANYKGEKPAQKLMLDGQRAWLTYRDAQCELAAYENLGGSIWPMLVAGCKADLTRQRTHQLVEMLQGEGN
jgi:uncharacterized protein YecT (DUF1311 family)